MEDQQTDIHVDIIEQFKIVFCGKIHDECEMHVMSLIHIYQIVSVIESNLECMMIIERNCTHFQWSHKKTSFTVVSHFNKELK